MGPREREAHQILSLKARPDEVEDSVIKSKVVDEVEGFVIESKAKLCYEREAYQMLVLQMRVGHPCLGRRG